MRVGSQRRRRWMNVLFVAFWKSWSPQLFNTAAVVQHELTSSRWSLEQWCKWCCKIGILFWSKLKSLHGSLEHWLLWTFFWAQPEDLRLIHCFFGKGSTSSLYRVTFFGHNNLSKKSLMLFTPTFIQCSKNAALNFTFPILRSADKI